MTSIRRRLLLLLTVGMLTAWTAAGAWTFVETHRRVDDLLDAQLSQSARLLLALAGHELAEQPEEDEEDHEEPEEPVVDDRAVRPLAVERRLSFQVWDSRGRLRYQSGAHAAGGRLTTAEPGFSDAVVAGQLWRVFSVWDPRRRVHVLVGQQESARRELVTSLTLRALAPVLSGLPLAWLAVAVAVRRALRPLGQMTAEVARRTPEDLAPLRTAAVPEEVQPLKHALDGLLDRLRHSVELERRFTADAAHELRTPLAAIRAHADVAAAAKDEAARQHALSQLRQGVERSAHLVDQLLTLARLDPGQPAFQAEPLDLLALARDLLAEVAPLWLARGTEVALHGQTPVPLRGDQGLLRILLRNLVDNAARHGGPGVVRVWVEKGAGGAEVRVEDSGPGLPPGERLRVFDRFQRGSTAGEGGSGLGLSIVRRIADLHGGRVELRDGPGGVGLSARVVLPG